MSTARMEALEHEFAALGPLLPEGPHKQALSLLHAMLLESRRERVNGGATGTGPSLEQIANLYRSAPTMEGSAVNSGLPVGTVAPDFALPDANGRATSLDELRRGGRNVLLVFYPLDWSPACSDQLSLYQEELPDFERLGTTVVGISVDSVYSHGAWAAVRGLTMPLLADFNPRGEVARRYHVWREAEGFSERALFLVDGAGVIRYAQVSPHLHQVPDIYALFEQLEALAAA